MGSGRSLRLLTVRKAADQLSVVTIDTTAAANDEVPIPSDVKTVFLDALLCWQLASQPRFSALSQARFSASIYVEMPWSEQSAATTAARSGSIVAE
jgi:hypothetical protein